MKIDNSGSVPPPAPAPIQKEPAQAESTRAAASDQVQLSPLPPIAADDASRSARIEQLRLQVQQGSYRVPAEDIARSIVDDALGDPGS